MIRPATIKDIPLIQSIAATTWPVAYGDILSQEQLSYMMELMYSSDSLQKQLEGGHHFYIASNNETGVGFASVSDEGNQVFKLNKLYVLPDAQKTGAGKALLLKAMEHAKDAGGTKIILQVNKQNNAKQFYEKQGFTVLEEKVLELEHGFVMDDYIMGIDV